MAWSQAKYQYIHPNLYSIIIPTIVSNTSTEKLTIKTDFHNQTERYINVLGTIMYEVQKWHIM